MTLQRKTPLRRKAPIGEQKRKRIQHEAQQGKAVEGLFDLHRVDWWHCVTAQTASGSIRAGLPDYILMGDGWFAMLEIKARDDRGRMGKMSPEQHTFHAKLKNAGIEVWTAYLPDDLGKVNLWLREKTGRVVDMDGIRA